MKKKLLKIVLVVVVIAGFLLPKRQTNRPQECFVWMAAIAAIPALINLFRGMGQQHKAKQLAKANVRPTYENQGQYEDLLQLMEKSASLGLDPDTTFAMATARRSAATGLNTFLQAGANANMPSQVYDTIGDVGLQQAQINREKRAQNVNAVATAWNALIGGKEGDWLRNFYYPYADKAQYASNMMQTGKATVD